MKRVWIGAGKYDGCLSRALTCMNTRRADRGSIYGLDLTNPSNESRDFIHRQPGGSCRPISCRHCDKPECAGSRMSGVLSGNCKTGIMEYGKKRYAGCFIRVIDCPFGVLKSDAAVRSRVTKCDFCKDNDSEPSYVRACLKKAIWIEEVQS